MIKIKVYKNRLEVSHRELLTEGNVNSLFVEFEFSSEWDGLSKIAVFENGENRVYMSIENGGCAIPWEVLQSCGKLRVSIRGVNNTGNEVLCTEDADLGYVHNSLASRTSAESHEPTEDRFAELENMIRGISLEPQNPNPEACVYENAFKIGISNADNVYTSDKSFAEISEAYQNGKFVYVDFDGAFFYLDVFIAETRFVFNRTFIDNDTVKQILFRIDSDDSVTRTDDEYESALFVEVDSSGSSYSVESGTFENVASAYSNNRPVFAKADGYVFRLIHADTADATFSLTVWASGRLATGTLTIAADDTVTVTQNAISGGGAANAVLYTSQTLTDAQKAQARENIGTYSKPTSGIPKTDLAEDVQESLDKADGALQPADTVEGEAVTLAAVAISGSYNDLDNKPTIPTVEVIYVLKADDSYSLYESTLAELNAALDNNSATTAIRLIDDVEYLDDYVEYVYSGYSTDYAIHNFSSVTVDGISVMRIDRTNGNITVSATYNPADKTESMTQAVGKDANGKLWTVSGGGGSFDIHSLETENDVSGTDEMPFYDASVGATVKTTWQTLMTKVRAFLDGCFVKSVNGKKDVVNLKAEDIDTDFVGREPQYNFSIEGEFDMGLIGILDADGHNVTAAEIIAALNSGLGVGFSVYDQTHSIEDTNATEFKYLISGTNVNIAFSVPRGHYHTPAVIIVSWGGSFWNEAEYNADTGVALTADYSDMPDRQHQWNTQEMLAGLDNRITDVRNDLPQKVSDLANDSGYLTLSTLPIFDGSVI